MSDPGPARPVSARLHSQSQIIAETGEAYAKSERCCANNRLAFGAGLDSVLNCRLVIAMILVSLYLEIVSCNPASLRSAVGPAPQEDEIRGGRNVPAIAIRRSLKK